MVVCVISKGKTHRGDLKTISSLEIGSIIRLDCAKGAEIAGENEREVDTRNTHRGWHLDEVAQW